MSKYIKITEDLLEYIKKAIDSSGSRLSFSKKIDVVHTTVRDWVTGKAKSMRKDVLIRVLEKIKYHMPSSAYDHYLNACYEDFNGIIKIEDPRKNIIQADGVDLFVLDAIKSVLKRISEDDKIKLVDFALELQKKNDVEIQERERILAESAEYKKKNQNTTQK